MTLENFNSLDNNQSYIVVKNSDDKIFIEEDLISKGPGDWVFLLRGKQDSWIKTDEFINHIDGLEVKKQILQNSWRKNE